MAARKRNEPAAPLEEVLIRICRRYEQRGRLGGTMLLGRNLDPAQRQAIEAYFPVAALSHNLEREELRLSLDRFLAGWDEERIRGWLDEVYASLGRSRPLPAPDGNDLAEELLERLRLAWPELAPVHRFLGRERQRLAARMRTRASETEELYFTAAEVVDFLVRNEEEITLSELGARLCGNSKALRHTALKNLVEQWLLLVRPGSDEGGHAWESFGVLRDRLTIAALVFAPLVYELDGQVQDWIYRLYRAGQPALVSWYHLEEMTGPRLAEPVPRLITCENEAPFGRLLREAARQALLFTGGFPNRAVRRLYRRLAGLIGRDCFHWGDSDVAGLRIAARLHGIHPLFLYRCDLATLRRHRDRLLPLAGRQQVEGERLLQDDPGFPYAAELAFTLRHGWLEQESWEPGPADD
jgi:hypothetical protein